MCILPDGMAPRGTMPSEARTTCGKHYGSICQVQQHLKRAPSCVRRCCELHPHLRRTRSHGSKCQGNAPAKSSKLFQGPPATCHRPCRGFSQIAQDFQTTTTFFLNCSVTLICSRHWHSFLDRRVPRSKVSGRPSLHSCSLLAADVARRSLVSSVSCEFSRFGHALMRALEFIAEQNRLDVTCASPSDSSRWTLQLGCSDSASAAPCSSASPVRRPTHC